MKDFPIFHLAIPIQNIEQAREFYAQGLGCQVGRSSEKAIIFNFCGHQLVAHLVEEELPRQKGIYPRHFGLVFAQKSDWSNLWQKIQAQGLNIYQPARTRFLGEVTEHSTFFLSDPFGNLLEFKYYTHNEAIFGAQNHFQVGDTD